MNFAISTLIPLYVSVAPYSPAKRFEVATAASIRTECREQHPTMTFAVDAESPSHHEKALDWLSLSREVLPDARPMTADERSSINEFFLAHFR